VPTDDPDADGAAANSIDTPDPVRSAIIAGQRPGSNFWQPTPCRVVPEHEVMVG
jgi:hypothetical protein